MGRIKRDNRKKIRNKWNRDKLATKRFNEAHKPCVKCNKSGVMGNTYGYIYIYGASLLKKYDSLSIKNTCFWTKILRYFVKTMFIFAIFMK